MVVFPRSYHWQNSPRTFSTDYLGSHRDNFCAEAGVDFSRGTGGALMQRAASAALRFTYHAHSSDAVLHFHSPFQGRSIMAKAKMRIPSPELLVPARRV